MRLGLIGLLILAVFIYSSVTFSGTVDVWRKCEIAGSTQKVDTNNDGTKENFVCCNVNGNFQWQKDACSADPCSAHTSCSACTGASGCGWCTTAGPCKAGTETGSNDGSCSDPNWAWRGECPVPPPPPSTSTSTSISTTTTTTPPRIPSCTAGGACTTAGATCCGADGKLYRCQ